jgi:concanavalin A-like lectin/glucanase superfamily protein
MSSFSFRRSDTIDHTKCGTSDSTSFTSQVFITNNSFKTVAHGGNVQNASGFDINFFSDIGLTSLLKWEMEFYDPVNGVVLAWVTIPTVSHTVDTPIYIGYGNASISSFQGGALSSVWPSAQGVYHLGNGSALALTDSSGNGNTLTNSATPVTATTGIIAGGAANFGTNTNNSLLSSSTPAGTAKLNFTISCWCIPTSVGGNGGGSGGQFLVANQNSNSGYALNAKASIASGQNLVFNLEQTATFDFGTVAFTNSVPVFVAATYDGTTYKGFVNGVLCSITYTGGQGGAPAAFSIGARDNPDNYWSGSIDEAKVVNAVRSADWLLTEYNNQSSPSTFYTLGPEINLSSNHFLSLMDCGT